MMSHSSRARAARVVQSLILAGGICVFLPTALTHGTEPSGTAAVCPVAASTPAPAAPRPIIGQASWYGSQFANRPTASGTLFDPEKLTAAHRKLPLGTKVVVTNLHNGRSVLVTINDRGPYWGNRDIDLSYRAARVLGMVRRGVARVRIDPL
jgi:rare lipoprotein A